MKAKNIKANDIALINAAQGTRRQVNGIDLYKYLLEDVKLKPTAVSADGATVLQIVARKPNQTGNHHYLIGKEQMLIKQTTKETMFNDSCFPEEILTM